MNDKPVDSLEQLLDRIAQAANGKRRVSLAAILEESGSRSFGPLILVAGLITVAPLVGDVPGVPTLMAVLVLVTAGQLLLRRDHIRLPRWLIDRSVKREKVCKAVDWLRPAAGPACRSGCPADNPE